MSNQIMTAATNTTAIVPEVWSARFYEVLLAKLIFAASISKDYEGEIQALGDSVNINYVPEFSAALDLAEDAAGDADAVTIAGYQLVINKRAYKDFIVTKNALLQSLPFVDKVREKAVFAIMKKMQADIIAALIPSASVPDHQISFTSGTTLALADILAGKELLDTQNVPDDGMRKLFSGVAQWNDLFNITGFVNRDYIPAGSPAEAPYSSGAIPTPLLGFQADWTTELGNVAYLFHPSVMTMAAQQGLNVAVYDLGVEGTRASRVNCDLLWGLKILDNKRAVKIG